MIYKEIIEHWHPNLRTNTIKELKKIHKVSKLSPKHLIYWSERGWNNEDALKLHNEWLINNKPTYNDIHAYLSTHVLKDFEPNLMNSLIEDYSNKNLGLKELNQLIAVNLNIPKYSKHSIKYWTIRGWDIISAENLKNKYKRNNKITPMIMQFWLNKGYTLTQTKEKLDSLRPTQIGYWVNAGYNELDAMKLVSNHQSSIKKRL